MHSLAMLLSGEVSFCFVQLMMYVSVVATWLIARLQIEKSAV